MIRAGRLKDRVDVLRAAMAANESGESVPTWEAVAEMVPAAIEPAAGGGETAGVDQQLAVQRAVIILRYDATLLFTVKDRLRDVASGQVYEVNGLADLLNMHREWSIRATAIPAEE